MAFEMDGRDLAVLVALGRWFFFMLSSLSQEEWQDHGLARSSQPGPTIECLSARSVRGPVHAKLLVVSVGLK